MEGMLRQQDLPSILRILRNFESLSSRIEKISLNPQSRRKGRGLHFKSRGLLEGKK
jgi:hypothetical protein